MYRSCKAKFSPERAASTRATSKGKAPPCTVIQASKPVVGLGFSGVLTILARPHTDCPVFPDYRARLAARRTGRNPIPRPIKEQYVLRYLKTGRGVPAQRGPLLGAGAVAGVLNRVSLFCRVRLVANAWLSCDTPANVCRERVPEPAESGRVWGGRGVGKPGRPGL